MRKLKPRETLIGAITLSLTVVFILYQWVIKPMTEGGIDIDDRLRLTSAQLIKADHLVHQKPLVEAKYKSLAQTIGQSDANANRMPAIVADIETAARKSNIHITNIQPQAPSTQKEAVFTAVELDIDGQWADIVNFLRLLQQEPTFFINELNLEKNFDNTGSLRGRIVVARMSLL